MNEPENPNADLEAILAVMEPGTNYSLHELIKLTGLNKRTVQPVLVRAAEALRQINCTRNGKRYQYCVASGGMQSQGGLRLPGEMQGYDEQWHRFREMCELTRSWNSSVSKK